MQTTLQRSDSGYFGEFVAMPSLQSRVTKSQGHDTKIVSIRDRVQVGTGDKG